jgi:hypothetical protein
MNKDCPVRKDTRAIGIGNPIAIIVTAIAKFGVQGNDGL